MEAPGPMPSGYWHWSGLRKEDQYKNDILIQYQKALKVRGVASQYALKMFVQQLVQENGALDPYSTHGDFGCAVGIPQLYVCSEKKPGYFAKHFLKEHPEWLTVRYQINYMADRTSDALARYKGNVKLAVISHNCPDCAAHNTDRYVCNLGKAGLTPLNGKGYDSKNCTDDGGKVQGYWRDEVNNPRFSTLIQPTP